MRNAGPGRRRGPKAGLLRPRRGVAIAAALALALGTLVSTGLVPTSPAAPAAATPGNPGVPSAPSVLYEENFENRPDPSTASTLSSYVGAAPQHATYTADPYWLDSSFCNGFILSSANSWSAGQCDGGAPAASAQDAFSFLRYIANALGKVSQQSPGSTDPADPSYNSVTASYTHGGSIVPGQVQFSTVDPLSLPSASGRFLTFSVNAGAVNCEVAGAVAPELRFYFKNSAGTETPVSSSAIDPCTDPRSGTFTYNGTAVKAGSFPASGSMLVTGNSVGIAMRNEATSTAGNDGAYDDIRVLDVTPQLDKSFSPASVTVNGESTLTFTVTNTSELASKDGWAFTDDLPDGLKVASSPQIGGTCSSQTDAAAGGTSIKITDGHLAQGEASCTITVRVTSSTAGTYENCAANITDQLGIDAPGCASVKFTPGDPLTCTSDTVYTLSDDSSTPPGAIYALNTATGASTLAGSFGTVTGAVGGSTRAAFVNGLGITPGGTAAYATQWNIGGLGGTVKIAKYDPATGTASVVGTQTIPGTSGLSLQVQVGAYNPENKWYYYGYFDYANGYFNIYAFDTTTNTTKGLQFQIDYPSSSAGFNANGDIAFDTKGNLYAVMADAGTGANDLRVFPSPLPVNGGATLLTGSSLAHPLPENGSFNGIAFGDDGLLYTSSTTTLWKNDPNTGAVLNGTGTTILNPAGTPDNGRSDMASCSYPSTLTLKKDITGRANPGDQFTVSITGNGVASGNEGTTTGTDTGLQDTQAEFAGPVVAVPGKTYTLTETGTSGADLTQYHSSLQCADSLSDTTIATSGFTQSGNTATATITIPDSGASGADIVCTFTNDLPSSLVVKKTVDPADGTTVVPGQNLTYSLTFENTGTGPADVNYVDDVSDVIDDAFVVDQPSVAPGTGVSASSISGGVIQITGTLQAGGTATVTYTVKVSDADGTGNGEPNRNLDNFLTPSGEDPPATCAEDSDLCTHNPVGAASLSLVKSADPTTVASAGETVTYHFTVTNTGDVDLSALAIDEQSFSGTGTMSAVDCPMTSLAVGASVACTATYAVTQADVDAGTVTNTAVAHGTPPGTATPVGSDPSSAVVEAQPETPAIEVVKSADPTSIDAAGQTVTYTFHVTNSGGVTLHGVEVTDAFTQGGTGTMSDITCDATTLAPQASTDCTATYTTDAADLTSGGIKNTATAHGTPPTGDEVTDTDTATVGVNVPDLKVTKSVDPASGAEVHLGDVLTYTITFDNSTGTAPAPVDYTDDLSKVLDDADVSEQPITVMGSGLTATTVTGGSFTVTGTVAPGATATATYKITVKTSGLGDLHLDNFVVKTGDTPPATCADDDALCTTNPVIIDPKLSLLKSAVPATVAAAGETVTYHFAVTNTGDIDLSDIGIDESDFSGTGTMSAVDCPAGALAAGASVDCTATYAVTQADIDAGTVTNTAVAHGTPPGDGGPVNSNESPAIVIADPDGPAIEVTKSAEPTSVDAAGQTVTYGFEVTNSGGVTLHDVKVTDVFTQGGTGTMSSIECADTTLAPGDVTHCEATYTTVDADLSVPSIENTATAHGTPPTGGDVTGTDTASVTVNTPNLKVSKSVDPTSGTDVKPGDVLTYTITFDNGDGAAAAPVDYIDDLSKVLDDAAVTTAPALATGSGLAVSPVSGGTFSVTGSLAAGDTATVTYKVRVKTAGLGDLHLDNFVVKSGEDTPAECAENSALCTQNPVVLHPGISIEKSASPATVDKAGDVVAYTFTVKNTGDVDLSDVTVNEGDFSGTGGLGDITCGDDHTANGSVDLAAGDSVDCTAMYPVTQADIAAGKVDNTATATGTPPAGDPVESEPADATVGVNPHPALTVDKATTTTDIDHVGQEVPYTFLVTNTGNVTLSDVTVVDTVQAPSVSENLGAITCGDEHAANGTVTLAAGASITCEATYTVSEADFDAAELQNVAIATGTPPTGIGVNSPQDEVELDVDPAPSIAIVKSADPTTVAKAGDTVTYTFAVTNTGNVDLSDVTVNEGAFSGTGQLGEITCGPDHTANGEVSLDAEAAVTCEASYKVTQADVDAGTVTNTAVAEGTPADCPADGGQAEGCDPVTSDPSTATVTATPGASIAVVKSSSTKEVTKAGQKVTYEFTVTNTGNVSLKDVTVTDVLAAPSVQSDLGPITCGDTPNGDVDLAAGASVTCEAVYTVSKADLGSKELADVATATGTPPEGAKPVSPESPLEIPVRVPAAGGGQPTDHPTPTLPGSDVPSPNLPYTGASGTTFWVGAGVALLVIGGMVLVPMRRRRRRGSDAA